MTIGEELRAKYNNDKQSEINAAYTECYNQAIKMLRDACDAGKRSVRLDKNNFDYMYTGRYKDAVVEMVAKALKNEELKFTTDVDYKSHLMSFVVSY